MEILIVIKNKVSILGFPKEVQDDIKKLLTISNPLFHKRLDLGLQNWGIPSSLKYYETGNDNDNLLIAPVGALGEILKIARSHEIKVDGSDIHDKRLSNPKTDYFSNFKFKGKLRGYQEDIVTSCMSKSIGIVEAMTGSGKTICFVNLTLRRKEPTLILVHTLELANQTIKSFVKFSNLNEDDIGFIGDGRFEVKPITIGLHQTMSKLKKDKFEIVNERFGQVIGDEIHIVGAETWFRTMNNISAKYKFGFTATPRRDDGLTKVIHFAAGPIIHKVPKSALENFLITPEVEQVKTQYEFQMFSTQEYQEMITDLSQDDDRNDFILDYVISDENKDKYSILLCTRISQVEYLNHALGDKSVMLTSKMTKKKRGEVMGELYAGEKKIVVSTYGLFSTGIDIPQLEILYLCAPIKSEVKLRQAAGRLMRMSKGKKKAKIIDFIDQKIDILKYQGYHRNKIFKKL